MQLTHVAKKCQLCLILLLQWLDHFEKTRPSQDEQEDARTGQGSAEEALVAGRRHLQGRRALRDRGGSRGPRRRRRGRLQVQGDGRLAHVNGGGITRFRSYIQSVALGRVRGFMKSFLGIELCGMAAPSAAAVQP